jgi:hypothetical protein
VTKSVFSKQVFRMCARRSQIFAPWGLGLALTLVLPLQFLLAENFDLLSVDKSLVDGTLSFTGMVLIAGALLAYLVLLLKVSDRQAGLGLEAECGEWR